jgi:hypothetical protein
MGIPINRIKRTRRGMNVCAYCSVSVTHIIDPESYPNDVFAKQDKLGWKCGNCVDRFTQDIIVHAAPNSLRAKEIVTEHTAEVNRHNDNARRLNNMAGHEAMKLKRNRFLKGGK